MTRKKHGKVCLFSLFLTLAVITVVIYSMFRYSSEMTDHIRKSFVSCSSNVLPTLFPFMIISSMIVKTRLAGPAEKLFWRPFRRMFDLPPASVTPFFLGFLCSFPVGALSAVEAYKTGALTKDEAERTMALSNNTGPAFVILLTGVTLSHNIRTGILIYFAEVSSAILTGNLLFRKKGVRNSDGSKGPDTTIVDFGRVVADSVSGAVTSCGTVAANVVFFSLVLKAFTLAFFITGKRIVTFLSVFLEFSEGVKEAIASGGPPGVSLAALSVCSGSLSVLFQVSAIASTSGLSVKRTAVFKLIQGSLGAALCYVISSIFPGILPVNVKNVSNKLPVVLLSYGSIRVRLCSAVVLGCLIYAFISRIKRKRYFL